MFTKSTVLKILVSSLLMLVSLNVLVNYFNNVESVLSKRKFPKFATNTNHTNEVEEARKNFINSSVITDYVPISKVNKSIYGGLRHYLRFQLADIEPRETKEMKTSLTECIDPAPDEGGPVTPNATLESLDIVEEKLKPFLKPGGWFQPIKCKAKHHVAIIVPFRDRYAHLSIFLKNIHLFLLKQNIEYRIFIIEQTNGKPFNRAALMNIGYLEALKFFSWDCFIFHDVDLLPLDERNLYTCPRQPRHMSVAIDTFGFRLPYKTIFGGVSAMTREHFSAVNGFSNSFFGWGGEDDDMSNRLKHANLYIARYPINIARYMMLSHQKERANPKRFENLVNGAHKFERDGLNSIQYEIYSKKEFPIFTWYLAELKMSEQRCQS